MADKSPSVDLHALGARVVSVFGPFGETVLIQMSAESAARMFPDGALGAAAPAMVLDAILRDIERIRKRDPALADSALAASAVAMAREIEHPFNSATSKSMCQARLADALRELRELAPPVESKDGLDEVAERRAKRRAGVAAAASKVRS